MRPFVVLGPPALVVAAFVFSSLWQPRLHGEEGDPAPGFDWIERIIKAKDRSNPTPGLTLVEKSPTRPDKIVLTEAAWRSRLRPEAFDVLRHGGTEPPF